MLCTPARGQAEGEGIMGFMTETVILKTIEKAAAAAREDAAALLAAQQETNRLLAALLSGQAPKAASWGRD